ncbi:hypothetical protein ACFPTR_02495 [Aliibacillus thermotolerans]|uniref:SPOR domain-containing protein n=1 Tax=Aliibacillus thermotolerans TaxID=1834418 RepID=A0ABW0U4J2_9BACI|nr:hypothetical protein [Aliibacillus thermotolerans]MDA3129272.1 hypothetical protein [Aliibacillus thermotolerans]
MKEDKHRVSFKLNGKEMDREKEDKPINHTSTEHTSTHQLKKIIEKKRKSATFLDNQKQRKRPLFLSFLSITGGATAVGLLFGFFTMHLFTESEPPVNAGYEEENVAVLADFADTHTLYIIQAGAFTSQEKGTEMQDRLRNQGYPALLTHDGDYYYLFTNMTFDQESSQENLQFYEEEGIDVYEKTRTISRIQSVDEDETKALLKEIEEIIIHLTNEREEERGIETLQTIIEDTAQWAEKENSSLNNLRNALIEIEKQITSENDMSSVTKEWIMEAILHFEETVYEIAAEKEE